jgi:pyruvate, water dikinase
MEISALTDIESPDLFGGKAVQLGAALRAGLPVPPGVALSTSFVDAIAAGDERAAMLLGDAHESFGGPLAVRSSAIGEDSAGASFAGQHTTRLNVCSAAALLEAVRAVWESAWAEGALAYRRQLGIDARPRVGVVLQRLIDPDVAGVLFTRNPLTGADERVIEAAWGLGEAVVQGLVIPDRFRLSCSGAVLERVCGVKHVAVRRQPDGGTLEENVAPELAERLCLDDAHLEELGGLADRCELVFGGPRDLEWAFAVDELYLLQSRPITVG